MDVNSLLAKEFAYNVSIVLSVGNDNSLVPLAMPKEFTDINTSIYLGVQPGP